MRWGKSWAGEGHPTAFWGGFHRCTPCPSTGPGPSLDPAAGSLVVSLFPLCRQQGWGCAESGTSGRQKLKYKMLINVAPGGAPVRLRPGLAASGPPRWLRLALRLWEGSRVTQCLQMGFNQPGCRGGRGGAALGSSSAALAAPAPRRGSSSGTWAAKAFWVT